MDKETYNMLSEIIRELDSSAGKLLEVWRTEREKRDSIKDVTNGEYDKAFAEASDICCSLSGVSRHLLQAIDDIVLLQDAYTAQTHYLKKK